MKKTNKFLIALDSTAESMQTVAYASEIIAGNREVEVRLFHVLPPIPPALLEFGGAEDPQKEQILSAELKRDQAKWINKAEEEAQVILTQAKELLHQASVSSQHISTQFSTTIHKPEVAGAILEAASDWKCRTIIIGRHSFPWFKEKTQKHVGEELVQLGQGLAIWVVE